MSEITVPMYVESVSSATVVLEKRINENQVVTDGTSVAMITVVVQEATAAAGFWGATGTCAQFDVIFRKKS